MLSYRFLIVVVPAALWSMLALLWIGGQHDSYVAILTAWGVPVNPDLPLGDWYGVLSWAQCAHQGIDVYLSNPCSRIMNYGPLWALPGWGTGDTAVTGIVMDIAFLATLPFVLPARTPGEFLVYCAAATSPMVVLALERANADVAIFVLVVVGTFGFSRSSFAARAIGYLVWLLAGLLKFYPLALLLLMVRERRVLFLVACAAATLILGAYAYAYWAELAIIIPNTEVGEWYHYSFSVSHIASGLADLFPGLQPPARFEGAFTAALTAVLLGLAAGLSRRFVRYLAPADWRTVANGQLVVGAVVVAACYFTRNNYSYRGIFLLLTLPALVETATRHAELRGLARWTLGAVLWVMWSETFIDAASGVPWPVPLPLPIEVDDVLWALREIAWCWIAAVFTALVIAYVVQAPAGEVFRGRLPAMAARRGAAP